MARQQNTAEVKSSEHTILISVIGVHEETLQEQRSHFIEAYLLGGLSNQNKIEFYMITFVVQNLITFMYKIMAMYYSHV